MVLEDHHLLLHLHDVCGATNFLYRKKASIEIMRLAHCQMPKFMDAKESKESFRRQTGLFLLYQPFLNHLRKPADVMQAKHKWDEFSEPDNP